MISRVADHCFWFGRYVERAESSARLLQATRTLVFDVGLPVTHCWQPMVIVSGEFPTFCERFGAEAAGDGERVQEYLTWSHDSSVSLWTSVRAARESARVIRDVLSLDTWEAINALYLFLGRDSARELYRDNREELYRSVRRSTQLILGLVRSTMMHDEPMSFLWLGTMVERAGQVARMLDVHHHTMQVEHPHDIVKVALLLSLLRACSGSEAFMKWHQGRVSSAALLSFLLFERGFPRSIAYCLRSSRGLLRSIWPDGRPSVERLDVLLRWLDEQHETIDDADVHALLTHIVDETSAICSLVSVDIRGTTGPSAAGGGSRVTTGTEG
jgi:uncharacterized alpha-E superfamily protein